MISSIAPMFQFIAQANPVEPRGPVVPSVEYANLSPLLVLAGGALVLLVIGSLAGRKLPRNFCGIYTALVGIGSLVASGFVWRSIDYGDSVVHLVANALVVDGFSVFVTAVIGCAVVLAALISDPYLQREKLAGVEFFVLMLLSACGAILMGSANDLIVLFLGLEILSIALYVLAGFHSRREESGEAAIKYFVLGAFSSALFLYGIALVYGATGSTNLVEIASFLAGSVIISNGVLLAGLALLIVGFGFKVAAVPFHTWTPDVYQGAPTPATAFMAAVAKAGAFAGLLRVFFSTFSTMRLDWQPIFWVLAVLSLVVGAVLAVVQNDIKRMLAYSSISHAGYVLIGLQIGTVDGIAGALFYLLIYTFMVLGSFAVVTIVGGEGDSRHRVDDYRGLSAEKPLLALVFTLFLLAQTGVPLTAGFFAKFYVIAAAVEQESYALALIGMLASVIAAFFYLRVIVAMYMAPAPAGSEARRLNIPVTTALALGIAAVFTLGVGIVPGPAVDFARHATLLL